MEKEKELFGHQDADLENKLTAVSVIGLGNMGVALAGAFLKAGYPTTVWNRSGGKAEGLVAKGASPAHTLASAIAASEVIVVCVSTYDVMDDLLHPLRLN